MANEQFASKSVEPQDETPRKELRPMPTSHLTSFAGVSQILDQVGALTPEQLSTAGAKASADAGTRKLAGELTGAMYESAALAELDRQLRDAVAAIDVVVQRDHLYTLCADAVTAVLLKAADAAPDLAARLVAPWNSIVG